VPGLFMPDIGSWGMTAAATATISGSDTHAAAATLTTLTAAAAAAAAAGAVAALQLPLSSSYSAQGPRHKPATVSGLPMAPQRLHGRHLARVGRARRSMPAGGVSVLLVCAMCMHIHSPGIL